MIVGGEEISIELSEQRDRVPHIQTEKEIVTLAKWQAKHKLELRQDTWASAWDKPRIADWDYPPNGRLTIELDKGLYHSDGIRRKFADGKRQRLENLTGSILVSAASISAARKTTAEQQRLQMLEWEESERQRNETERTNTLEHKRWECLELQMARHEKARRVEDFVEAFKTSKKGKQLSLDCEKFILWAETTGRLLREAASPEALTLTLERYKLMDDTTNIPSWTEIK